MTALVTGGGRGIGRGIALRLAKAGMAVAVSARSADQLDETVSMAGGKMIAVAADVADPPSARAMVREVEARLGPVDLLINNAGIGGPFGPIWEADADEWWRCQEVNLRGPFVCCREILPGMIARKSGRIINIVSGAGCQAFPDMSAYVAGKTALIRLSEQIAVEAAPHGVCAFALRPGIVRTAMLEEALPKMPILQKMLDDGREVSPDVVADLVLLLASGRADALSGRILSIYDDQNEILRRAADVVKDELYLLRVRALS
jgi:NAD(P)-dependent dehydrogenase (short-subunit alcohol dehydrogenase family)